MILVIQAIQHDTYRGSDFHWARPDQAQHWDHSGDDVSSCLHPWPEEMERYHDNKRQHDVVEACSSCEHIMWFLLLRACDDVAELPMPHVSKSSAASHISN